ncbi:serine/threonine protein kinase [Desulfurobacterium thermolithotrophum DSM 11699]|uniref:Serine/threonine protein kinase n=1 Tax=Desulfurobacterium thermolithotrophum (strain DSM 11699 / BSA) TaxID=868864 RepID=F0S3C4_DESTD|nr:AarF/UbiB family protein [Desulfurobacterium thermolithotrophum]ADY73346.1 serine/threonine protein kinase [Desulfurobacterium thermolithotrophum DSM 11699]
MRFLHRFWQILGYLYFCTYEHLTNYIPEIIVRLIGFFLFHPYRFLLGYPPPQRLRIAFENLGAAYLKIGQILSTRVDVLPAEYVKELEKLQDRVPPEPLEEILKSCQYLKEHVLEFEREPIGSGSVAQVHWARLKDGREVAIKILRPKAKETIKQDIKVLKKSVSLLSNFIPFFREFRILKIIEELERVLLNELNLTTEAAYMELFRKFSSKEPSLYIPEVIWELTRENVLVIEFIKGRKLNEIKDLPKETRKKLANDFVKIVNRMVFELGIFHGDLHPGNIFILENGKFAFIDFGIVGRLSPDTLAAFFSFSVGVMNKDPDLIINSLKRIGAITKEVNVSLLKREILIFLDRYYNRPLSQIDAEKLFYEELSAARKFKIILPEELVILMKTIAHTESIARLIYDDFRLPPLLKPYLKKLAPKMAINEFRRKSLSLLMTYVDLIEKLPERLSRAPVVSKSRDFFWGIALLGSAVVLSFAPKIILVYLFAVYITNRFYKRQ